MYQAAKAAGQLAQGFICATLICEVMAKFKFRTFGGRERVRKIGLPAVFGYPRDSTKNPNSPKGMEAEHAAYPIVPCSPTGISMRFYPADLRHLCRPPDRVDLVLPTSLCHRTDSLQRLHPQRTSQSLPSLLQPCLVVARYLVLGPGTPVGRRVRPHGPHRTGGRRYPVPQTWSDRYGTGMHHDPLLSSRA